MNGESSTRAGTLRRIIRSRFSCRRFHRRPVPREVVLALLDDARWAPSGGNLQPWRFVVVERSPVTRELAAAAHGQGSVAEAPLVVVVCAVPAESASRYGMRGVRLYSIQDAAAATQNLLLSATARGLGSCWVGAFDEEQAATVLGLPPGWRPLAMVPLGYPAEAPGARSRKPMEEVVLWIPAKDR